MRVFACFAAGVLSVVAAVAVFGCLPMSRDASGSDVVLRVSFTVDEAVCDQVKGKRRPQLAVWLEDMSGGEIRTVCVTSKTGRGAWGANITRPVSLPYWVGRWNVETGTEGDPSGEQPALEAVTCATPQAEFERSIVVRRGTRWQYFIEVNQAFDNNERFAEADVEGRKDMHANGQPSIVYTGRITALPGRTSTPELVGRTEQLEVSRTLNADVSGITTARGLLRDIVVSCDGSPPGAGCAGD